MLFTLTRSQDSQGNVGENQYTIHEERTIGVYSVSMLHQYQRINFEEYSLSTGGNIQTSFHRGLHHLLSPLLDGTVGVITRTSIRQKEASSQLHLAMSSSRRHWEPETHKMPYKNLKDPLGKIHHALKQPI